MTLRHFLSWKTLFYDALLPVLRQFGPAISDRVLSAFGRWSLVLWPPKRREFTDALTRAKASVGADWSPSETCPQLAANAMRFLARDYPLDVRDNDAVLSQFDVTGFEHLRETLDRGRGAIVVGSHLGSHIAALHWLYRREVPIRLLVQRPRHVSRWLNARFDRNESHPQSGFFLRRDISPSGAAERLLRARAALRDGLAVYLSADIPWPGPNSRPGRLLGQSHKFLSVWADLAVVTQAPVIFVVCTHRPGGRYAMTVDEPRTIAAGEEQAAVSRYLACLEHEVAANPADAIAYLTWPCYGPRVAPAVLAPRGRSMTAVPLS